MSNEIFIENFVTEVNVENVVTEIVVETAGARGPRGEQGIPGEQEGATFAAAAGATVHGHRVVKVAGGLGTEVDTTDRADMLTATGISIGSALAGEPFTVRLAGYIDEPSWSWAPGPIFAGNAGTLTQTQPLTGWSMEVARAVSQTRIVVGLQPGIWRGN